MTTVADIEDGRMDRASSVPTFEEWVDAHIRDLTRFAVLVVGTAADDAVQEALSRAYPRWDHIARTDDPSAYVRRMIVNAHISWWRRAGRHEIASAEPRRDAAVELSDREDELWRLCATLPVRQRAVIVLRFYEGLSHTEVAEVLGVSSVTARSQTHRALKSLRVALEESRDD